ncbi:3-methyl-2-oxobutanoate hydroxymethyltransferase [bacterium]|nr:3-methyl-2-oxobutanoate hydroxymethyltransferase [bacterium]
MKKITVVKLGEMKKHKERITMLTCYNYWMAKILNEAEIEVLLVGDSLGMVVLGYENTLPVKVEDILYHTKAVKKGNLSALLVADMPFMSYQLGEKEALLNCSRMLKEGGAEAVKIEGGAVVAKTVKCLVEANIPVMGHIGLTPQAVHKMGGYRVQGRGKEEAERLIVDAQVLEEAGVFSLVLEGIPEKLSREITKKISVPTIGIGAGKYCDGQVLVSEDLLGLTGKVTPKFVKQYVRLDKEIKKAVDRFKKEVKEVNIPIPLTLDLGHKTPRHEVLVYN